MPRIDHKQFYMQTIKKFGTSAKGVAWSDEFRQKRRFAAILAAIPNLSDASIVDGGCGFGDLWLYMRQKGTVPKSYIGIDMLDFMVEEARERTKKRIFKRNILKDPLPEADWYVVSGALNLLTRFETLLAVKRMMDVSKSGVVFNLLKGEDRSETFNYWMPQEIRKSCANFGRVEIYEGYIDGDFTVKIVHRGSF